MHIRRDNNIRPPCSSRSHAPASTSVMIASWVLLLPPVCQLTGKRQVSVPAPRHNGEMRFPTARESFRIGSQLSAASSKTRPRSSNILPTLVIWCDGPSGQTTPHPALLPVLHGIAKCGRHASQLIRRRRKLPRRSIASITRSASSVNALSWPFRSHSGNLNIPGRISG